MAAFIWRKSAYIHKIFESSKNVMNLKGKGEWLFWLGYIRS